MSTSTGKKKVLVTDSLFIFQEHVDKLEAANCVIERLDKPAASEEELIEAIKGKHGYILGGIEHVTDKIIAAADCLEALVFTGTDWLHFVPGHEEATKKGIAVSNCPGANARAVAEFALALMLSMQRNLFELGRTGDKSFQTCKSLLTARVGIIGLGTIGATVAKMLKGIGVEDVSYYSKQRKPAIEKEIGIKYMELSELLKYCDVVSLHTSKAAGTGYIGKTQLALLPDGALIIDTSFHGAIDPEALHAELSKKRLRAAADHLPRDDFKSLPLDAFYYSNASTAYNTNDANQKASDIATESMINLLSGKEDRYVVNGIKARA
jgi:gluconate 2-dehydrogenase